MNIFKKIGIILSCSIIAFLGVFGVVVTNSNVNTQVKDLPVVERHNLVGSDVVLNENNYSNYTLTVDPNVNDIDDDNFYSGDFTITGYFLKVESQLNNGTVYRNYSYSNETLNIIYGGFSTVNGGIMIDTGDSSFSYFIFNNNGFNFMDSQIDLPIDYELTYLRFLSISLESQSLNESMFLLLNNNFSEYDIPLPDQFLPSITTIVSDVITWFVNVFTGLSDTFVITDTNGTITGLSAWGQVLFIGVAILLVSMALKWVISLVRGI